MLQVGGFLEINLPCISLKYTYIKKIHTASSQIIIRALTFLNFNI